MGQLASAQLNVARHDLSPPSRTRSTSTSPTSGPQTTLCPRPPLVLATKERRDVGRHIQYACPDEMCTRTPAGTGRTTVLSNRPAQGQSVTSVSTPLIINKTTPRLGNVTRVSRHRPNPVQPDGRSQPLWHGNHDRESQLSHFD
jgi:hypothetical protein